MGWTSRESCKWSFLVTAVFQRTEDFWLWVKLVFIRLLTTCSNVDDNYFETGETYHKRLVHWNNQIVKSWSIFEVYYMCVIDVNITCILISLFVYLFHGIYFISLSEILAEMLLKYPNWNKDMHMIDWLIDWLIDCETTTILIYPQFAGNLD